MHLRTRYPEGEGGPPDIEGATQIEPVNVD